MTSISEVFESSVGSGRPQRSNVGLAGRDKNCLYVRFDLEPSSACTHAHTPNNDRERSEPARPWITNALSGLLQKTKEAHIARSRLLDAPYP